MARIWLFNASARALDTFKRIALRMPQSRASIWWALYLLRILARQEGLEPPTPGLEGPCSIQLSYCRAVFDAPEYIRAAHFTLLRKKVGAPGS